MKNKRFNYIFSKNLILISCLVIAFSVVISTILVWQNNKIQQDKIKLLETEIATKNESSINNMFSMISASCLYLSDLYINYDAGNLVEDYVKLREIQQQLKSVMATFNVINSIEVVSKDSNFYVANTDGGVGSDHKYEPGKLYGKVNGAKVYQNLSNSVSSIYIHLDAQSSEYISNSVYIGINTDRLAEYVFSSDLEERDYCLVNKDFDIILSTFPYSRGDRLTEYYTIKLQDELFQKNKAQGETFYTSVNELKDYELFMVSFVDESVYHNIMSSSNNTILVIMSLITICALSVIILIFRITYMPIKQIMHQVNGMPIYHSQVGNEVQFINEKFSELNLKNKELTEMVEDKLQQLTAQHIAALQMQICPHFIYNTLDFINYMAYDKTKDINNNISVASRKLADIFKSSMTVQEVFRTIREEIELTQTYIDILMLRTEDTFKVEMDIDENLYDCAILKLSIQPLLENVAVHAVDEEHPKVNIFISVKEQDEYIEVSVSDDGVGIEKTKLKQIQARINDFSFNHTDNIGLRNVNERLQELYGAESALQIKSEKGAGTTCSFKYPKSGTKNTK